MTILAVGVVVPACTGEGGGTHPASTTSPPASSTTTALPSTTTALPSTTTTRSSSTTSTTPCVSTSDIDTWPVRRRAAQLLVLPVLDFDVEPLAPLLREGTGGVLFLGSAAAPPDLRSRLAEATAGTDPTAAPLVLADVEGGGVQRLKGAVDPFPWPRELAATMSVDQVGELATTVAEQMVAAGVGVDLAPVLDLDDRAGPSAANPVGRRSFSLDPATAGSYGIAFARGLQAGGVLPVAKHFPGLGGATGNTDNGPAATRPYAELRGAGLRPFVDAIAAGVPAIMVSNASTPGLTTEPASVSAAVIGELLRTELGFRGLVVTDSLSAGAITEAGYSLPEAAAAAIEAGADLILFGSTLTAAGRALLSPANVAASRQAIIDALDDAVASGRLTPARLDDAVSHVLAAKGISVCGSGA